MAEKTLLEGAFLPGDISEDKNWTGTHTLGNLTTTKFTYGANELIFSEASGTGTIVINGTTFRVQASY